MRIDWDDKLKIPRWEKLLRIVNCHTGHKHGHRKGPGRISNEQRKRRLHNAAVSKASRRKWINTVRAYWTGEREEHP